jgi:hypothetical protein
MLHVFAQRHGIDPGVPRGGIVELAAGDHGAEFVVAQEVQVVAIGIPAGSPELKFSLLTWCNWPSGLAM